MHPAIRAVAKADGLIFGETPFAITHLGYEGDLQHKHRRNLPLLIEAARNQPRRVYHRQQLTEIYGALGEREKAIASLPRGDGDRAHGRGRRSSTRMRASARIRWRFS